MNVQLPFGTERYFEIGQIVLFCLRLLTFWFDYKNFLFEQSDISACGVAMTQDKNNTNKITRTIIRKINQYAIFKYANIS